jgi:hypothetical protein
MIGRRYFTERRTARALTLTTSIAKKRRNREKLCEWEKSARVVRDSFDRESGVRLRVMSASERVSVGVVEHCVDVREIFRVGSDEGARREVLCKSSSSSSSSSSNNNNNNNNDNNNESITSVVETSIRTSGEKWSQRTQKFAELATLPLLAVTLPQIILNSQNIMNGNGSLLAGISYEGYACGALGNLLLLSYFSAIEEPAGRNIQAIGVVNTSFLLSQLYFTGNCGDLSFQAYLACTSVALFGVVSAYFKKEMFKDARTREILCNLYERFLGVIGYTSVPYILTQALFKTSEDVSQLFAFAAFCMILLRCAKDHFKFDTPSFLDQFMNLKWQTLMGWTATLLFSLLPIAQISTSTANPTNISSLSLIAVVLGGCGNSLMLARAWHIRDWCWTLGAFGGSAVGSWGVLVTMFMYGHKQVPLEVFLSLSMLYWGWVAFVILYDSMQKKLA